MGTQLAVFLPGLYGGGAERTMLNLAEGFAQRGVAVDLVVGVTKGSLLDHVPDSVRYLPLNATRSRYVVPSLASYLKSERPQTLLTALNRANLAAIWARSLARVPCRLVISERNQVFNGQQSKSIPERLYPRLGQLFYPWADEIVAVSQSVADDLVKAMHLERTRITVIKNPVVTPALRTKAEATLQHPWVGANEPPLIVSVGRLSEQKDLATLIRAFARLRKKRSARLLILGEGPRRTYLETLISQLEISDDVLLPGWVPNPVVYVREATLFVLSSRWEGLPGALIEALYCGTPIVATDAPGGTGEVLAHGRYGLLVPVGDVDKLAGAICRVLAGEVQRPPAASWEPYELNRVLDQYAQTLEINC